MTDTTRSSPADELLELGDGLIELDRNWVVVRVNAAQERITGKPRSETVGRVFWEIWPDAADPQTVTWREYHRCMEERVSVEFEDYFGPLDAWFAITTHPTSAGGIAVLFRDVSGLKRSESTLRDREERLRSVLENMSEGLIVFDATGNITYQNPAALRIHGTNRADGRYERDEIPVTWRLRSEPDGPYVPFHEWVIPRVLRGERVQEQRYFVECVEDAGRSFVASYNGVPVTDAQGKVAYGLLTMRDITEQTSAEASLRHANEQLREADRRKDEFLGVLSHELRNPLAPIRNSIFVLNHAEAASSHAEKARRVIQRQTDHLSRLVDDLLDVTRIVRGKIQIRRERVDLADVWSGTRRRTFGRSSPTAT